jgi:hypothetical protein
MGIIFPMIFDRWEVACRGNAGSIRKAKFRAISGEYGPMLDAITAYDRETKQHLLIVRNPSDRVERPLLVERSVPTRIADGVLDRALDLQTNGDGLGISGASDGLV